ncbi:hypothetical protein [Planctomycetes bacterium CA13]|uniref:hypothetical protein n=1 Tax=Novipirellula herctigrandis TaxID=2527986 RepID=UPI0011B362F5
MRLIGLSAASITAIGIDHLVKQRGFGAAAIHHVQAIALNRPLHDRPPSAAISAAMFYFSLFT